MRCSRQKKKTMMVLTHVTPSPTRGLLIGRNRIPMPPYGVVASIIWTAETYTLMSGEGGELEEPLFRF
jgi:hypothetical protein